MSLHVPDRRDWTCTVCRSDWPCHTRRQQLRAQYADAPASLDVYLRDQLAIAVYDQPGRRLELTARFLSWAPQVEPR